MDTTGPSSAACDGVLVLMLSSKSRLSLVSIKNRCRFRKRSPPCRAALFCRSTVERSSRQLRVSFVAFACRSIRNERQRTATSLDGVVATAWRSFIGNSPRGTGAHSFVRKDIHTDCVHSFFVYHHTYNFVMDAANWQSRINNQ